MVLVEHARWLRVTLGETVVRTTEDVRISASLDNLNRVCTFTLAEQPAITPADGAAVTVELVNLLTETSYFLFGGIVDGGPETESEPWNMAVRAVDQLADLRIVKTGGDMDLTGLTPKEAKMEIFDYCELTYDPDDLVNVDYELGALVDVKWLADGTTTAAQIIQEIDRVFGLTTQTIANNRIISFRYELMPEDGTGLYRSYVKSSSFDFRAHHRTRGSRNDIQTLWFVTGVAREFNDGACTDTPWAKAVHGTARVGRSRRVPTSTDQSDLIQDESLAEYVVRQHMQRTSGIPDSGTAATITSRNYHPGTKIAITDLTYGIMAEPRYYCVTQVEITGLRTDLTLVAGPPGNEGTVTHGVDRVCNDTHTDTDLPGDFEPPDYGFPPLDDGIFDDGFFPDPDIDIPEFPDTTSPFLDCTDSGELIDLLTTPWRTTGIVWRYDSETDTTLGAYTLQNGQMFYNTTPSGKTSANDVQFGQAEVLCVSGTVRFCDFDGSQADQPPGARLHLHIAYFPFDIGDGGGPWATANFWVVNGIEDPFENESWGISGTTENTSGLYDGRVGQHECVPDVFGGFGNNGGYQGSPLGWETEGAFSVCFDPSVGKMRNYYAGDFGAGYHEDLACAAGEEIEDSFDSQVCEHTGGHKLELFLSGDSTLSTAACPWVEITSLSLGMATCTPNPNYIDPNAAGGEGGGSGK